MRNKQKSLDIVLLYKYKFESNKELGGGKMKNWEKLLKESYRSCEEMKTQLLFSEEELETLIKIEEKYPVCVNPYYFGLIDLADKDDPIRKMCIPNGSEFSLGGEEDTSGEAENTVFPGMQHKYKQTALILSTNQCAMYCRHCFRKRLVGISAIEIAQQMSGMVEYVKEHIEINNVLISGGDAFLCNNELISEYLDKFSKIKSIEYLRLGTRIPVVLPQRIIEDLELQGILRKYAAKKTLFIITQFNHPNELTSEAKMGLEILRDCGCIVRNQMVLLKGVNDHPEIITLLMNSLVKMGVIPYYIFQCRPVIGVKNQFQLSLKEGSRIVEKAKEMMSGQAKCFRYVMSHPQGKIEIIGEDKQGYMVFKFHQVKEEKDGSKIFCKQINEGETWLYEL